MPSTHNNKSASHIRNFIIKYIIFMHAIACVYNIVMMANSYTALAFALCCGCLKVAVKWLWMPNNMKSYHQWCNFNVFKCTLYVINNSILGRWRLLLVKKCCYFYSDSQILQAIIVLVCNKVSTFKLKSKASMVTDVLYKGLCDKKELASVKLYDSFS